MHFFYQALMKKSSLYRNHKEKKNEVFSYGNREIEFHNVLIVLKEDESENYDTISCTHYM